MKYIHMSATRCSTAGMTARNCDLWQHEDLAGLQALLMWGVSCSQPLLPFWNNFNVVCCGFGFVLFFGGFSCLVGFGRGGLLLFSFSFQDLDDLQGHSMVL